MTEDLGMIACRAMDKAWSLPAYESWQAVADAVVAAHEARRWRPIAEAHEDFGVCVFVNLVSPDPVCASTLDDGFEEMKHCYGWTHFAPIVLTTETAERLKAPSPRRRRRPTMANNHSAEWLRGAIEALDRARRDFTVTVPELQAEYVALLAAAEAREAGTPTADEVIAACKRAILAEDCNLYTRKLLERGAKNLIAAWEAAQRG